MLLEDTGWEESGQCWSVSV